MEIKTKVDKYKYLFYIIKRLIHHDPFGEKFEDSYREFLRILIANILENKKDLVIAFHENICKYNDEMSHFLKSATNKERAFFNAGRFKGLCDCINELESYEECLKKFLEPYMNLKVGDIVYIRNGDIIYKTTIVKKVKEKIQVKYANKWFTQDDYLENIFPCNEKKNLYERGALVSCSNCDGCAGFRQKKCSYGYSLSTHYGFTYRFDNTKYKVLKGRPEELCCKNVK